MIGEIQPAANIALDAPDLYPALYGFLAETDVPGRPKTVVIGAVLPPSTGTDRAATDREQHRRRVSARRAAVLSGVAPTPEAEDDKKTPPSPGKPDVT